MKATSIEGYKNQLLEMHDRLTADIRRMDEAVGEHARAGGESSHVPTHPADCDSEGIEKELSLEKTEGELLNQVNTALRRIEHGSYGACEDCGKNISRDRLRALPFTPYCITCEEEREREPR